MAFGTAGGADPLRLPQRPLRNMPLRTPRMKQEPQRALGVLMSPRSSRVRRSSSRDRCCEWDTCSCLAVRDPKRAFSAARAHLLDLIRLLS